MEIVGHRGAAGEYPENTVYGFNKAFSDGVRSFELDVQLSKDDKPMIIHDNDTARTTHSKKIVRRTHSQLLMSLGVPTLFQMLPLFEQCEHIQLEIKDHPAAIFHFLQYQFIYNLTAENFWITSDNTATLDIAERMLPDIKRGIVFDNTDGPRDRLMLAEKHKCQMIVFPDSANDLDIERAKRAGLATSIYTINDYESAGWCKRQGLDYMITDLPSSFI